MWKKLKVATMGGVVVLLITTACGSHNVLPHDATPSSSSTHTQENMHDDQNQIHSLSQNEQVMSKNADYAIIPILTLENIRYVSAKELIQALKFQSSWDNEKLLIGDNDANYEFKVDSKLGSKEGDEIQLNQPLIKQGDTAYMPLSTVADMFREDMSYEVKDNQLLIYPYSMFSMEHEDKVGPRKNAAELDFEDDPADPFKGDEEAANSVSVEDTNSSDVPVWMQNHDNETVPVLKQMDIRALISKGEQYLGVKYEFGAASYPQSGKFDCSTFTQYIFGKYGVKLPRLAREQAAEGRLVSRKSLRKGDLMFFYVPGRFKSNKTIGHVGIYIGNMRMLHASPMPENGVQITNIDKPYWKETFLRAKRVAY